MKVTKTASGKKTIKMSKREWESLGKKAGWMDESEVQDVIKDEEAFTVGDSVTIDTMKELVGHSRSVPPHMGYTTEEFSWRDTIRNLKGKVGIITRVFPNSKHVNVEIDGKTIGIDSDKLNKV